MGMVKCEICGTVQAAHDGKCVTVLCTNMISSKPIAVDPAPSKPKPVMEKPRSQCAVLVPVARNIETETERSLRELAVRGYQVFELRGGSAIDMVRCQMVTDAIANKFKETMWIDADTGFHPDQVDHLRALDLPFVAGMYPCKGPKRMAGKLKDANTLVRFGEGGGVVEATVIGMGFTYIRIEVYDAICERGLQLVGGGYDGKNVLPFFMPFIHNGVYLSEDYAICERARAAGFPPMVDTRLKIGHWGRKEYTWDDLAPDRVFDEMDMQMQMTGEIVMVSGKGRMSK